VPSVAAAIAGAGDLATAEGVGQPMVGEQPVPPAPETIHVLGADDDEDEDLTFYEKRARDGDQELFDLALALITTGALECL
jgi:hypothetical protein